MADHDIRRLRSRLQWESRGPLTDISNRATDAVIAGSALLLQSLRRAADANPLISLLIAAQIGFAIGHWWPRHAKH